MTCGCATPDVRALAERIANGAPVGVDHREHPGFMWYGAEDKRSLLTVSDVTALARAVLAVPPTPPDYVALEAKARAATPGPWRVCPDETRDGMVLVCCGEGDLHAGPVCVEPLTEADAEWIAAAHPQAVLALIADVRRHRARMSGACSKHPYGEDPDCAICYDMWQGATTRWRERAEAAEADVARLTAERDAAHRRADGLVQSTLEAEATLHRLIADQREKREAAEQESARLREALEGVQQGLRAVRTYPSLQAITDAALASAEGREVGNG